MKIAESLRHGAFRFVEKLLRWSIYTLIRTALLRLLGARVAADAKIEEATFINLMEGFKNLSVGEKGFIGAGTIVDLCGPVDIGARAAVSPGCILMTHSDPGTTPGHRLSALYPREVKGIKIGNDVWVGAGAVILCGVTIGDRTVIGAGSVVNCDIPGNCLACGNPAVVVKTS